MDVQRIKVPGAPVDSTIWVMGEELHGQLHSLTAALLSLYYLDFFLYICFCFSLFVFVCGAPGGDEECG